MFSTQAPRHPGPQRNAHVRWLRGAAGRGAVHPERAPARPRCWSEARRPAGRACL